MGSCTAVIAQDQAADDADQTEEIKLEEVVVTGTSLRGVPPAGQDLITLDRSDIEMSGAQSTQQLLQDVPQITGFGNGGQGSYGSADGSGSYAPTLHSMGASASNGTLILIDGHRLPLTGLAHTLADPSIIPPVAIERVEILPAGASSVYGSDAVAGVINFVTRRNFDGWEFSGQVGFADAYDTRNFNAVTGNAWSTGSYIAAYSYSYRSALFGGDRPDRVRQDLTPDGRNYATHNCSPATIQVGSTRYQYPYGATDTYTDAFCNVAEKADIWPEDERNSFMIAVNDQVSDNVGYHIDSVFSERNGNQLVTGAAGPTGLTRISTTAYGPGSTPPAGHSINPFFVGPPGAIQETVNFDTTDLVGPAQMDTMQRAFFVSAGVDWEFTDEWFLSVGGTVGVDHSERKQKNGICAPCAIDLISGPDLTTSNALDVWGSGTSPAVFAYLTDAYRQDESDQSLTDFVAKVDGPIFSIGGNDVKLAVGAETIRWGLKQDVSGSGVGPSSTNAQTIHTDISRDVLAFFGEVLVPVTDTINLGAAVRHDDYSDFGGTTNPTFSVDWQPMESLRLRASYAESFTAPALTSRGEEGTGRTTESGWGEAPPISNGFIGPDFSDPRTAEFLATVPGCANGCVINAPGPNWIKGMWVTGGNDKAYAATGESLSLGFDLVAPDWAPGLSLHVTYWDSLYEGMVTAPLLANIINVPGLNSRLVLLPTEADIAEWTAGLPQSSLLPPDVWFLWSFQQINAFNIDAAGFDIDIQYDWDTDLGQFSLGWASSHKTRFDQQAGSGGEWVDFLNVDANTTFSSLKLLGVARLDWHRDNIYAGLRVNYTNAYKKLGDPLQSDVGSYTTVNLRFSYRLQGGGFLDDLELYANVDDLFDEDPPFYNEAGGYNATESSPLGRLFTVGFRKTF